MLLPGREAEKCATSWDRNREPDDPRSYTTGPGKCLESQTRRVFGPRWDRATPSLTPDRAGQGRKHGSMTGPGWANWAELERAVLGQLGWAGMGHGPWA